jgi:hypothetical protein
VTVSILNSLDADADTQHGSIKGKNYYNMNDDPEYYFNMQYRYKRFRVE